MTTAPTIPAATRRALDDWLARGYAITIAADGTLKVTPPQAADDLDLLDFTPRKTRR